jgi:hypothetical protein
MTLVKLCECGCGRPAPIATITNRKDGRIKGQPQRFVSGHNTLIQQRYLPDGIDLPAGTKAIPLTQGKYAIVDEADYKFLMQWRWHASKDINTYYAVRYARLENGKSTRLPMHRVILKAEPGTKVDHRDRNGLNNTRGNLRPATAHQNCCNRAMPKQNTSGYKGVTWHKQCQKWAAQISVNRKNHHLGLFEHVEDAARAYNEAALLLHGEFASLNREVQS